MGHVLQNETQGRVEKASAYVRLWHQRVHNGALDGYLNTMIDDFIGNNPSALYYFDAPQGGARSNFNDPFRTLLDRFVSLLHRLACHPCLVEDLVSISVRVEDGIGRSPEGFRAFASAFGIRS